MRRVIPMRHTLVAVCILYISHLCAAESEYCRRFRSLLDTNNPDHLSECFLRYSSLIDTNNVGPMITNSLPRGRLVLCPAQTLAGISLNMTMSEVVGLWGKPRLLWGPDHRFVRLGYDAASLSFAGDRLTEIWISR